MIQFQRSKTLNATPEAVWVTLSDYMNIDAFAPGITKVDALSEQSNGLGAKRRCHFPDGNSVVEEVTTWTEGRGYRVALVDLGKMPLKEMHADIRLAPNGSGKTHVTWSIDFATKFGPLGWIMGQALMKPMMRKALDGNLQGLEDHVTGHTAAVPQPS